MGAARDAMEMFMRGMAGDLSALEQACTPDVALVESDATLSGIAQVKQYAQTFATAFPDAHIELRNVVEAGEHAAAELTYSGTHTGPLAGPQGEVPPSGKSVALPGSAFITVRNGKVASFHGYYDHMAMMAQMGMLPAAH